MTHPDDPSQHRSDLKIGTWAAIASYAMWGLFPVYWKQIIYVDAIIILCHRIIWSAAFLLIVLWLRGATKQLVPVFRQKQSLVSILVCAVLITANWGIYIWAVNAGKITEASLGYYITPLLSVALGSYFFKEKMDRWTGIALTLAALGVAAAAIMVGKLPWVSVSLAASFAIYGAVKKKAGLDALTGLAAETIVAAPFAALWLFWAHHSGDASFLGPDIKACVLLIVAGPVTAIPLLTFAYAAVRIPLQRIGLIQYFSPTIQLVLGLIVYGEGMNPPTMLAFVTVVAAAAIYLGTRKLSANVVDCK